MTPSDDTERRHRDLQDSSDVFRILVRVAGWELNPRLFFWCCEQARTGRMLSSCQYGDSSRLEDIAGGYGKTMDTSKEVGNILTDFHLGYTTYVCGQPLGESSTEHDMYAQ